MDDDEAALAAAEAWEPDPVNADPTRSSRTRRMSDIIAALVGIYGSKELFINEYRRAAAAPSFPAQLATACLRSDSSCSRFVSRADSRSSRCRELACRMAPQQRLLTLAYP